MKPAVFPILGAALLASVGVLALRAEDGSAAPAPAATTATAEQPAGELLPPGLYAVWETPRGPITAELFFREVPLSVATFVALAEGTLPTKGPRAGQRFYDGLVFHRVVPGFVAQGGDPLGTGQGDAGFFFQDEFSPQLKHDEAGVLALANSGPNTNSCQFYFTLAPVNRLNYKHTVFGRVVRGREVLPRIAKGDAMSAVRIVRVGAEAEAFRPDAAQVAGWRERTPVIARRDPARPRPIIEAAGLGVPPGSIAWLSEKLHHYAATTGVEIWVRMLARAPAAAAASGPLEVPEEVMGALVGSNRRAAVLAFFADEGRWRLWLGDELLARFSFAPGEELTGRGMLRSQQLRAAILAPALAELQKNEPRYSLEPAITGLVEALDRPQNILQGLSPADTNR